MICTALCAAMIYQACGLDKKIRILSNADFLCCHYKIDPYKAIVQKQSVIFSVGVDLFLGDDGRKKFSEVFRAFTPCLQTNLCNFKNIKITVNKMNFSTALDYVNLYPSPKYLRVCNYLSIRCNMHQARKVVG